MSLKIISFVFASLLALFVHYSFVADQENSSVVQLIVPVEIQNLPRDLTIIWPNTRQAEVALRGPSASLARVVTSPPIFRVEVPTGTTSRFTAALKKEDLRLSDDVEVLSVRPATIDFRLDNLIEKSVGVIVPRIGQLPRGLQMISLKPKPEAVVLYGPESELKTISSVETTPLDLRELSESTVRTVSVRVPGAATEARTPSLEVHIEIAPLQRQMTLRNVPIVVRGTEAQQFEINPKAVLLELSGSESQLANIDADKIEPFVSALGSASQSAKVRVALDLPPEVSVVRIEPAEVTLTRKPGRSARTSTTTNRAPTQKK